ncbi:aspartate aminotransferase family protein [Gemmatimonadota bacterium]
MVKRDYSKLLDKLEAEHKARSPKSAELHDEATQYLIDGGSHSLRLLQPFSPRIVSAQGAWITDEDGHEILDFWQGHFGNILGHNPSFVTDELAEKMKHGFGLQTGFADRLQIEVAELICRCTGAERVRFTCTGALATMYAIMLARSFTGRSKVLKVGGGWHGANPWGLKGVGYHDGFDSVESEGIPTAVTDEIIITRYNDPSSLVDTFEQHGDELACFLLEPVIGAGGRFPATREYMHLARELTENHGVVLIHDEVVSGFRYAAKNAGSLYGVTPDLMALGKAIGGGMPVAAVAGRRDILDLVGRDSSFRVKFSGGTYSAHPASLLAAKLYIQHLLKHESEIYPHMAQVGAALRNEVTKAFESEGVFVRFAGDRIDELPGHMLHPLLFPYEDGADLTTPDEVLNPAVCDTTLGLRVVQMALLVEDVYTAPSLPIGSHTAAHTFADVAFLAEKCRTVAYRIKPYL